MVFIHNKLETERQRDLRGVALLTFETEADGDSRSTYERGPSVVGSLGSARHAGTRDNCSAFAALVGPVKKFGLVQYIFFLTVYYFNSFVPIAKQAGQAVMTHRLSLNKCLWI
jgi:hypothetical protein